jgi:hypothetical protein
MPSIATSNNNSDWHRLLLTRLRSGMTEKCETKRSTGDTSDIALSKYLMYKRRDKVK